MSSRRLRSCLIAIACATVAVSAASCANSPTGRAADGAAPLLEESASALAQVPAVDIRGFIAERSGSTTVSISVDATSAGPSGTSQGSLDLEGPGLGFTGPTSYIVVDGITYVKAGTPFWKSLFGSQTSVAVRLEGEILPLVLNRWVELSGESTEVVYKDTLGLSEPRVFVAGSLAGKGTLSNAGNQTLYGLNGVEITSSTGAKILLAASGPPLPLAFAGTESASGGFRLNLVVGYPTGVTISAPAHPVSLAAIEAALSK